MHIIFSVLLFCSSVLILIVIFRSSKGFLNYVLQSFFILLTALFYKESQVKNYAHNISFDENTAFFLSMYLFVGLVVLFTVKFAHLFSRKTTIGQLNSSEDISTDTLNFWTMVYVIIITLKSYLIIVGSENYFVQTLSLFFDFFPLLVGLVYNRIRKSIRLLFFIIIILNFVIHIVQSSRGTAIVPVGLFALGYFTQTRLKLNYTHIIFIIILIPIFITFNKVESYRKIYGRGLEVNAKNVNTLWNYLITPGNIVNVKSDFGTPFGRLINHPNLAVFYLSPHYIKYRETQTIKDEFLTSFSIQGPDRERKKVFDKMKGNESFGNGVLNRYGYSVSASSSWELSILADGYSRGGIGVMSLYIFITIIFLLNIEIFLQKRFNESALWQLLLFFLYFSSVFTFYPYPLMMAIKTVRYRGLLFSSLFISLWMLKRILNRRMY